MKSETKSIQGVSPPGKQPTESEGEGTYYRILKAWALGITEAGKFRHPLSARLRPGKVGGGQAESLGAESQQSGSLSLSEGREPGPPSSGRWMSSVSRADKRECCFPPPFCSSQPLSRQHGAHPSGERPLLESAHQF